MNKIEDEVWKPVSEVWWVEVSPYGNVRTLDRVVSNGKGTRVVKGQVLKQQRDKNGYLRVHFSGNGKNFFRFVHRLVAQAFIPNPDNLPEVNHKDCNPTNNNVSNLEWITRKGNNQYRNKYGVSYKEAARKKPVCAINLDTLEVYRFPSQMEASRVLGANVGHINNVISGKRNHTHGYWFTNINSNTTKVIRHKFDDSIADKVAELLKDIKMKSA
ncbi:DNA endonuclease I [Lactiplantibacillus phage Gut-P1]|nr:DNA endonuclease I [Lactiplantibacillus phage Gut-P1]